MGQHRELIIDLLEEAQITENEVELIRAVRKVQKTRKTFEERKKAAKLICMACPSNVMLHLSFAEVAKQADIKFEEALLEFGELAYEILA